MLAPRPLVIALGLAFGSSVMTLASPAQAQDTRDIQSPPNAATAPNDPLADPAARSDDPASAVDPGTAAQQPGTTVTPPSGADELRESLPPPGPVPPAAPESLEGSGSSTQSQGAGSSSAPAPGGDTAPGLGSDPRQPAPLSGAQSGSDTPYSQGGYTTAQSSDGGMPAGSTTGAFDSSRYSVLPYTSGGYVGLNIGKPEYDTDCGTDPTLECDDPSASVRIYTGGMFNEHFGLELGYTDFGNADRAGGETDAQGLDITALARMPLGPVSVFGKLGATYARTKVSAAGGTGVVTGSEKEFAPNVGAGLSFDLNRQFSVLLEWDRHDLKFPGGDRDEVTSSSLGVKYMF